MFRWFIQEEGEFKRKRKKEITKVEELNQFSDQLTLTFR